MQRKGYETKKEREKGNRRHTVEVENHRRNNRNNYNKTTGKSNSLQQRPKAEKKNHTDIDSPPSGFCHGHSIPSFADDI